MKIRPIACLAALIHSATQISCTPLIGNGCDHRHGPKFKAENESRDYDE
jgi:hypothetical protein